MYRNSILYKPYYIGTTIRFIKSGSNALKIQIEFLGPEYAT